MKKRLLDFIAWVIVAGICGILCLGMYGMYTKAPQIFWLFAYLWTVIGLGGFALYWLTEGRKK